jgi:hypothetical protein
MSPTARVGRPMFGQSVKNHTPVGYGEGPTIPLLSIRSGVRTSPGSPFKRVVITSESINPATHSELRDLVDFGVIWGGLERKIRPEFGQSSQPISAQRLECLSSANPPFWPASTQQSSCVRADLPGRRPRHRAHNHDVTRVGGKLQQQRGLNPHRIHPSSTQQERRSTHGANH